MIDRYRGKIYCIVKAADNNMPSFYQKTSISIIHCFYDKYSAEHYLNSLPSKYDCYILESTI